MEFRDFIVVYYPFPQSDLTAEAFETGKDEEEVRIEFEKKNPEYRVKEVR